MYFVLNTGPHWHGMLGNYSVTVQNLWVSCKTTFMAGECFTAPVRMATQSAQATQRHSVQRKNLRLSATGMAGGSSCKKKHTLCTPRCGSSFLSLKLSSQFV